MLDTEKVKKIAEYIGYEVVDGPSDYVWVSNNCVATLFNYKNLFEEIFKALVDECKKRNLIIQIDGNMLGIGEHVIGEGFRAYEGMEYKFNNESICLAYLAVMESK